MKKFGIVCLVSLFLVVPGLLSAQNKVDALVKAGIRLHDAAKYDDAIASYQEALKIDPTSAFATYELAFSYFMSKRYAEAIEAGKKVIGWKGNYVLEAYNVVGNSQDLSGKPKEAIKTYKKGMKAFPENHLLAYNLGLT